MLFWLVYFCMSSGQFMPVSKRKPEYWWRFTWMYLKALAAFLVTLHAFHVFLHFLAHHRKSIKNSSISLIKEESTNGPWEMDLFHVQCILYMCSTILMLCRTKITTLFPVNVPYTYTLISAPHIDSVREVGWHLVTSSIS